MLGGYDPRFRLLEPNGKQNGGGGGGGGEGAAAAGEGVAGGGEGEGEANHEANSRGGLPRVEGL